MSEIETFVGVGYISDYKIIPKRLSDNLFFFVCKYSSECCNALDIYFSRLVKVWYRFIWIVSLKVESKILNNVDAMEMEWVKEKPPLEKDKSNKQISKQIDQNAKATTSLLEKV